MAAQLSITAGISGLREQIFANAVVLYPKVVRASRGSKPDEIFDVILLREEQKIYAALIYGDIRDRRLAWSGPLVNCESDTVYAKAAALNALLDNLCEAAELRRPTGMLLKVKKDDPLLEPPSEADYE